MQQVDNMARIKYANCYDDGSLLTCIFI